MSELRNLKGAFSLISILEDDDKIDNIICDAIENNLDIDDLSIDEFIMDCYMYQSSII